MAKKRFFGIPEDAFGILHLQIVNFSISTDASINYEVRIKQYQHRDAKVYKFDSDISIDCKRLWPEEYPDWNYHLHIYGHDSGFRNFADTLSDCQVVDDYGRPIEKKRRGKNEPVYDIPHGLGYWEKTRGEDQVSGSIWVSPECLSDMMIMLVNVKPLYADVHEVKKERTRWIQSFRMQTEMPE